MMVKDLVQEVLAEANSLPLENIMDDLKLLTIDEVSAMLSIAKPTLYNLVNRGELPATKVGRAVRFRTRVLYAYLLAKERFAEPLSKVAV